MKFKVLILVYLLAKGNCFHQNEDPTCDDPKCLKCDIKQNCLECKSKFDYIRINSCLSCDNSSYFDKTKETCLKCNQENCLRCTKETETQLETKCEECKAGYSLSLSDFPICYKCDQKNCLKCDEKKPSVCSNCQDGYFIVKETSKCLNCRTLCKKCNGKNECIECEKKMILGKDGICRHDGGAYTLKDGIITGFLLGIPLLILSLFLSICLAGCMMKLESTENKFRMFIRNRNVEVQGEA